MQLKRSGIRRPEVYTLQCIHGLQECTSNLNLEACWIFPAIHLLSMALLEREPHNFRITWVHTRLLVWFVLTNHLVSVLYFLDKCLSFRLFVLHCLSFSFSVYDLWLLLLLSLNILLYLGWKHIKRWPRSVKKNTFKNHILSFRFSLIIAIKSLENKYQKHLSVFNDLEIDWGKKIKLIVDDHIEYQTLWTP